MATEAEITVEQYLDMTFEYDAEFVDGEIVARSWPDVHHSRAQAAVAIGFGEIDKRFGLLPCIGVRMNLRDGLYRVADVAVFSERPAEPFPEQPPLVVVEILSPDDRHHDLMEKLEEYRVWGIANIWVVDPLAKRLAVYTAAGLQYCSTLNLPEYPFELTPSALFNDL
jgi:Uma2 family endonuclease